ncbi:MAG: hypothetical protein R3Y56_00060 [Akkermansia sp.]
MQFIILLALILSLTAWIVSSYHRLEQLRILANSKWQLVLASLHRRNSAVRELVYRLGTQNEQDMLLRQLRHIQGDYELSLSSPKNLRHPTQQLQQIARYEDKLSHLLRELTSHAAQAPQLQYCFEQVQQFDQARLLSIKQYNAAVTAYRHQRELPPYRQLAQLAQQPDLLTWETRELLR